MVQCMLTYSSYKTPAEFDAGYANNIDAAVVAHWEAVFRERSAALAAPRLELTYGPDTRNRIDFFPAPNAPPGASISSERCGNRNHNTSIGGDMRTGSIPAR